MDLGRGFRTYSEGRCASFHVIEAPISTGALRIGSQENTEILIIGGQLDILTTSDEGLHLYNLLHAHARDVHFQVRFWKRQSSLIQCPFSYFLTPGQECPSIYGHDAFLIDYQWFVPKIRAFLDTDLS